MVVTNIELYEALKRDLNEDAARMIAEVVPAAADLAKGSEVAAQIADLKSSIDSRLHRMTLAFLVPMWTTTLGVVAALVTLALKL
jgi:hypothetical protein